MKRVSSTFAQVLRFTPRLEFEAAVREHRGATTASKRSTLAYAKEHRPWELFASVFHALYPLKPTWWSVADGSFGSNIRCSASTRR